MWQTGTSNEYQDLLTKLVAVATGNHADSAVIAAGGTGYTVGDILTTAGGTSTFPATFKVLTAPGGIVGTVSVVNGGAYTVNPTNPASTTGGTGTGCTLTLTMSATGWTAVRNTTPGGEKEVILQGIGSGSDTIFVGLKTYQQVNGANTAFNWVLTAMTGFNSGLLFENQPGVSPNGLQNSAGGAYVPLKTTDGFPMTFWFSVTGRRIIGIVKIENGTITSYASFYLGFLNPFGTSTEFPYPIFVAGASARNDCLFNTTAPSITGLAEMVGISGRTGPAYGRLPNGTWVSVRSSVAVDSGSPTRSANTDYLVYPTGKSQFSSGVIIDDIIVTDGVFNWSNFIPGGGIPGTASDRLQPTPNTAGALRLLVPCTITYSATPDFDIWGELDGVFWVSEAFGELNGDTITQGGVPYLMVQCGNRNGIFSFMAVKET